MRRLLPASLGVLILALAPAAPAGASWVKGARVAGPGPIVRVGGAALGPDGTGAVAYVRKVGDKKHHNRDRAGFIARIAGGEWARPTAIAHGAVDDIQVGAGLDGRLALAWLAKGTVYGLVSGHGAVAAPVELGTGARRGTLQVRMRPDGTAYAVWTQDGAGGTDVRAAQLEGNTWTALGAPLDADPNRAAGTGSLRPAVAVSADGSAVAAWGELYPDGSTHVFARRLSGTDDPPEPVEASVPAFGTEPGGSADSPQVDAESNGDGAWVAFREDVGTRSRSLVRRFGGGAFGEPAAIDGGATSRHPAVAVSGTSGVGTAGGGDGSVIGSLLDGQGAFGQGTRLDPNAAASAPGPLPAWSDVRAAGAVAFRTPTGGGTPVAYGRLATQAGGFQPPVRLSASGAGPVLSGSLHLGADPAADALVAMLQGKKADKRRLVVALQDSPPLPATVTTRYVHGPRPRLSWEPGTDAFGSQRFTVRLDGKVAGRTRGTSVTSSRSVEDGRHRVQVESADQRGQTAAGAPHTIVVDSVAPKATVTAHRRGRVLRVQVRASDDRSHVARVDVRWGDGRTSTSTKRRHTFRHRYAERTPTRVRVTVRDRAGNRSVHRFTA